MNQLNQPIIEPTKTQINQLIPNQLKQLDHCN